MIIRSSVTSAAGVVRVLIIYGGLLVMGLIAVVATARFGALLEPTWAAFPGTTGFRGIVFTLLPLAFAVAAIAVVRRMSDVDLHRWMPWAPMLLLITVRAIAIPLVETPLQQDNDPIFLHELALGVLDEGRSWLVAHRPMGFSAMLAGLYAVFGVHLWLGELLNLGLAVVAGWMLHRFVLGAWGPRPAAAALTLYALVPSQVLLVTALYTETAYSAVLMAAIALAAGAMSSSRPALAVGAGVLLAVSQYVRPLSQAFLPVFIALPFLSGLRLVRAAVLAAAIGISFLVVLAPIVVHNAAVNGDLSLSTSSYAGWSVFVGANQEQNGRFNRDDQAILRETEGSIWERSEILGRAGIERITEDPRGFAELAVRKFRIMWGDDTYAVDAALPGLAITHPIWSALLLVSQGAYAGLSVAATVGLWRQRRHPAPAALLLAGVLVIVAAAHTVVEVQPRYHAYLLPLLCALAALAVAGHGAAPVRAAGADDPPDPDG